MRILMAIGLALTVSLMISTPVSAQFFLCEKVDNRGNVVSPESPQYKYLEYDNNIVYFLQEITGMALLGAFLLGIFGSIYAALKDTVYTPEADDDASKYVRMRSKLLLAGVVLPIVLLIGSWILEWATVYETTCFISIPFV